ncbi:hypothetical protein FNH09_07150 [Streptomyces adustus]|uniref:Uncharacterized protein n=1 Tax=Streptomyces adustus TaxID=1609272 RepID=A0A5N8VAW7_9ACTN|nr:hypothetical protein [Streptomyces adustus]
MSPSKCRSTTCGCSPSTSRRASRLALQGRPARPVPLALPAPSARRARTARTGGTARTARTGRTGRTARTGRTPSLPRLQVRSSAAMTDSWGVHGRMHRPCTSPGRRSRSCGRRPDKAASATVLRTAPMAPGRIVGQRPLLLFMT